MNAGIMLDHSTAPAWGDTVDERYAKMKRVAEHFMLMQVGLCVFHEEDLSPGALPLKRLACDDADDIMPEEPRSPSKRLVARPFNFYVFPSATNKVEVCPPRSASSAVRDFVSEQQRGIVGDLLMAPGLEGPRCLQSASPLFHARYLTRAHLSCVPYLTCAQLSCVPGSYEGRHGAFPR